MVSHRYDIASNKVATMDSNGHQTLFIHDAFGRVIETIYPPTLNEAKAVCHASVKKEYNAMSNVTKEIDAKGITKQMRYTIRGQLAEVLYPDGTTEKNTYHLNGTIKESKAKNNTIMRYTSDHFNRPIQTDIFSADEELLSSTKIAYSGFNILEETDAAGLVTTYTYYPDGKVKSKKKGDYLITFSYDSLGRQNKTTEFYGSNPEDVIVKTKGYDLLNRVTAETVFDAHDIWVSKIDYTYDAAGNVCQIVNYTQTGCNITKHIYDSHGTLILSVDGEGNQTVTVSKYDYRNALGQLVAYQEITDPKGNVTIAIADVLGRTVEKIKKNAYGKTIQKQEQSYDLNGNLCSIVDVIISPLESDQEIISIMLYDTSNRLTSCYEAYGNPEQKQTKITYNTFGQKESLIKNDGVVLFHTYDAMGRLEILKSSDGTIDYSYQYDLNSNPILVEDRINKMATARKYDSNGFLIHEELGNHLNIDYCYDYIGRTKEITLPDSTKIAYEYNANQLKNVNRLDSANHVTYTHQYQSYDYSGNLTKALMANQAGSLSYHYDVLGRLKSVTTEDNRWSEQIKSYDSVGNILETSLHDSLGEISANYAYDDLYQITYENGAAIHSYSYDSHYNRRTKNDHRYQLNPLHQIINDGIFVYSYDRNGNMQGKKSDEQASQFTYDALDRLITFEKEGLKFTYCYDENNRRLSKTFYVSEENQWKAQKTIRYLYQGENEIGAVNARGEIKELRILGLGKGAEIGAAIAFEIDQKVLVPLHDHIGNVACLLDSLTGAIVETYRYSSFGEELFDGSKAISPWRFSSKRTDAESGLVYFGRRYYDSEIGRWVTPDPIGREGGPNLYAYVLNCPLTHFDLYGLYGMADRLESVLGNICVRFAKLFSFFAKIPGHIVGFVGKEIPIPYVNHLVEFGGWCLRGQNPAAYDWSQHQSQLLFHQGKDHKNSQHIFMCANGICTSREEQFQRMAELSESYGGVNVYGLHSGGNGTILDLLEVGIQKLGIPTNAQLTANRSAHKILKAQGELRNETTIFMNAHSRGTETVYNLDRSLRDKMKVTAFGPARIASEGHYQDSNYYISPLDGVPLFSPVGYYKGVKNGNVHFLPTTGNPLSDHMYSNEHFQNVIKKQGSHYQNIYGKAA